MSDNILKRTYYPALDGVRGIAILLVVVFHNYGFIDYFFFGWLGVDLFFVLSGFLITGILLKTVGKPKYLQNFYIRRTLRIFPLYYLLLIICLLVLPELDSLKPQTEYYTNNQFYFWIYAQNWLFALNPPENSNFLFHLWSLGVEEQFYLIWPFLILWIKKPKILLLIVSLLLIGIMLFRSWLWIYQMEGIQYFSLYAFSRIDGICIGCMLALINYINFEYIRKYTSLIVISIALLNFAFYFLNKIEDFSYPYYPFIGYTTFGFIFAIVIYEATRVKSGILYIILTIPILRFIGKISYGFYIFHWPIYFLLNPIIYKSISPLLQDQSYLLINMISATICTLIGFIVSIISYYYFETPILKLKEKFSPSIQ